MLQKFVLRLLCGRGSATKRIAIVFMPLLACALAVSAVCAPPTATAPVMRPPTTTPQTIVPSAQTAGEEVFVNGQSLGSYNLVVANTQQVIGGRSWPELTLKGTPNAAQGTYWEYWWRAVTSGKREVRDVVVVERARDGHEIRRWTLHNALLTKFAYLAAEPNGPRLSVALIYESIAASL